MTSAIVTAIPGKTKNGVFERSDSPVVLPSIPTNILLEFATNIGGESNSKTVTANGTYLSTDSRPGTIGGCIELSGSTGWVDIESNVEDEFYYPAGTDFTIEFFYKSTHTWANSGYFMSLEDSSLTLRAKGAGLTWNNMINTFMVFYPLDWAGGDIAYGDAITPNLVLDGTAWNHIVHQRQGDNYTIYTNGVKIVSRLMTQGIDVGLAGVGRKFTLGSHSSHAVGMRGKYDGLRVIKGTAIYSGDTYTVPFGDY